MSRSSCRSSWDKEFFIFLQNCSSSTMKIRRPSIARIEMAMRRWFVFW